jgi:hypothetical protein
MFIYGIEGSGKTRAAMTIKPEAPEGVAYITPESGGPTSLLSAGYPSSIQIELLENDGNDPFEKVIRSLQAFGNDPKIHTICVDGCTGICGKAIDHFSNGRGEKAMGYDGWGYMLNGWRQVEAAAEKLFRKGKNIIYTAWEMPPTYSDSFGTKVLDHVGRPYIMGKGQLWLPGNVDIIARITSTFVSEKDPTSGKMVKKFKSTLNLPSSARKTLPPGRW